MGKTRCGFCAKLQEHPRYTLLAVALVSLVVVALFSSSRSFATQPERQLCTVQGTSMAPTLVPGDTVYIQAFSPDQYNVGDIIVFNMTLFTSSSDNIWIHRVVARTQAYGYFWYMTKGDNNSITDPLSYSFYKMDVSEPSWFGRGYVRQDLILGEVVEIVKAGGS